MVLAMLLFAALLVTLLVLAVLRLRDRPSSDEMPRPVVGTLWRIGDASHATSSS